MTPTERVLYERLRRRAAALEPQAARRYLAALEGLREALGEAKLAQALREGSVDRLLSEMLNDSVQDRAFSPLRAFVQRATLDAASLWVRDIPGRVGAPAFNVLTPRVIDAVRELDTRVMQELRNEVRETARQAAQAGLEAGAHPREVARGIRDTIGLAPNQEEAVRNFRRMLEAGDREALTRGLRDRRFDRTLQKALGKRGTGLSADQVDRMTDAYRKRMIAFNAETHARSMALDAQRLAQRMSWQNAIDQGTVDPTRLYRQWVDSGDGRVRPEHREMGKLPPIPFNQRYPNGQLVPGESDYGCRCIERIILMPEQRLAA